jgi:hypothetical protein
MKIIPGAGAPLLAKSAARDEFFVTYVGFQFGTP